MKHLISEMPTPQPFAFAVFSDQQSAIATKKVLNGMVFDLEKGSALFIHSAKSNSRSKRPSTDEEWIGSDKKFRGSFSRPRTDSGSGSVHMSGTGNSACNMIGYPPAQSSGNADTNAESTAVRSSATTRPTLFVANLGASCIEEELIQVFSRCPGFLKLKMQSTYEASVAFVDFQVCPTLSISWDTNGKRFCFTPLWLYSFHLHGYWMFNRCNELPARVNSMLIASWGRHASGVSSDITISILFVAFLPFSF